MCDGVKMDEFCKDKGFIGWFETSAKENIGVDEAAQFLVSKVRKPPSYCLPIRYKSYYLILVRIRKPRLWRTEESF